MPNDHIAPEIEPTIVDPATFGKGCIPTPEAIKASQYVLSEINVIPIDWSKPHRVPAALIQKNQDGSSSCTAQSTNYYVEVLNQLANGFVERYNSRFIYSQTVEPGGGAYIWKAMSIPLIQGAASLDSISEGDSSEAIMTDRSENYKAVIEAKPDKYAQLPTRGRNIDYLANIVIKYNGFITGFNGWDGMFSADGTVVDWSQSNWGHAVYICGFETHNGRRCLVFKNSWGSNWGDGGFGYLPEEFLSSGMVFDAYVYAQIADLDPHSMVLSSKHVRELQALEGYKDEAGVTYWTGKMLADYLAARLPDKVKTINEALVVPGDTGLVNPPVVPPVVGPDVPKPQPPVIVKETQPMNINANVFTINDVASAIIGVGLANINSNLPLAMSLLGVGVGLKVLIGVLQKLDIPVSKGK